MVSYFLSQYILEIGFVLFSDPTPVADPLFENVKWPKVEANGEVCYLNINTTLSIDNHLSCYPAVRDIYVKYMKPPFWIF